MAGSRLLEGLVLKLSYCFCGWNKRILCLLHYSKPPRIVIGAFWRVKIYSQVQVQIQEQVLVQVRVRVRGGNQIKINQDMSLGLLAQNCFILKNLSSGYPSSNPPKDAKSYSNANLLRIKCIPNSLKYVTEIKHHLLEANCHYLYLSKKVKSNTIWRNGL